MIRKGLGKGQGKGYKNIIPNYDKRVHSDSGKGIKQPQIKNVNIKKSFWQKTKENIKNIENKAKEKYVEYQELRKKKQEKNRLEALELANHPLFTKYTLQQQRVDTLQNQIENETDDNKIEKLKQELEKEQEDLREIQEKITKLPLSEFTDEQLRILAVKSNDDGLFSEIFGSGNKYEDELIRRVKKREELKYKLRQAKKEADKEFKQKEQEKEFSLSDLFK